jgi:hypothetical protein
VFLFLLTLGQRWTTNLLFFRDLRLCPKKVALESVLKLHCVLLCHVCVSNSFGWWRSVLLRWVMQGQFRTAHHRFDLSFTGIVLLTFLDMRFLWGNFHGLACYLSQVIYLIKLLNDSLFIGRIFCNIHSIFVNCHPEGFQDYLTQILNSWSLLRNERFVELSGYPLQECSTQIVFLSEKG